MRVYFVVLLECEIVNRPRFRRLEVAKVIEITQRRGGTLSRLVVSASVTGYKTARQFIAGHIINVLTFAAKPS